MNSKYHWVSFHGKQAVRIYLQAEYRSVSRSGESGRKYGHLSSALFVVWDWGGKT
jgi:HEPN domain-containing protein